MPKRNTTIIVSHLRLAMAVRGYTVQELADAIYPSYMDKEVKRISLQNYLAAQSMPDEKIDDIGRELNINTEWLTKDLPLFDFEQDPNHEGDYENYKLSLPTYCPPRKKQVSWGEYLAMLMQALGYSEEDCTITRMYCYSTGIKSALKAVIDQSLPKAKEADEKLKKSLEALSEKDEGVFGIRLDEKAAAESYRRLYDQMIAELEEKYMKPKKKKAQGKRTARGSDSKKAGEDNGND